MNKYLPFFIGLRYSRSKKHQFFISIISFISIAGIALGVCVLITVLSVMNGFDAEIGQKVYNLTPQLLVLKDNFNEKQAKEVKKKLLQQKGVVGVAPYVSGQGIIKLADVFKPILVTGIIPEEEQQVANLSQRIVIGAIESLNKSNFNIIISDKFAFEMGVSMGDQLIIMVPTFNVNPFGVFPRTKRFTVSGIFSGTSGLGYDNHHVYMNLKDAQILFNLGSNISGLRAKTTNLYIAPLIKEKLQEELTLGFTLLDWTEQFGSYINAIKLEKTMMLLILVLLVVIAAFNLVSSLVMLVNEKQMDIAILRTMGAKPGTILSIFVVQGSIAGIIGTGLGIFGGIVLASHVSEFVDFLLNILNMKYLLSSVYFVDKLPSLLLFSDLLIVSSISLGLSFLATIYPAWRASRLQPAATLRYE